jgi:hypothetical protein
MIIDKTIYLYLNYYYKLKIINTPFIMQIMSERGYSISIVKGVNTNKVNYSYVQPNLYEDPFKEVKEEHRRILNYRSKPCPHDLPEKLKPHWKGHLEFSFTPCETGWMYLQEQKKLGKKK